MSKVRLTDVCNITTGNLDSNAAEINGKYPYFTCAPDPLRINSYAFDYDAILLAGNNASGNFHCQRYNGKFNAYQRTYVITAKAGYDIDYVFYNLKINLIHFKKISQGSQTKFLTMQILNEFMIEDIPFERQVENVSILKQIDQKIENNNKIISKLESLAKTIYDYWFLQFEFPNEDGKPYKSSGGKMVWNEELKREIPEGWGVQTVNDSNIYVSDFTANGSFKGLADNVKYNTGEKYALLIRIVDFNNNFDNHDFIYVDKHAYDYLSKSHLLPNDIIICNVGAVGSVYRCPDIEIPMTLGPNGIVVKSSKGLLDNYLYLYFKYGIGYRQLLSISSGSIQMKFNKTNFRELPLLLPPTDINEKFNHIISSIFSMKNNSWKENKKLASLRDFLLPMLMNGQVTFKD